MKPGPEPPILLALLRVVVGAIALVSPEPDVARAVAARAPALWIPPEGLGWLGAVVPLDASSLAVATVVLRVAAALVIAGALTRAASAVLAASLLYVFGAAQLTGTVTHDMHLVWFAALLAVGPSGEALSIDGWARDDPLSGGPPTAASTWAVTTARAWLGAIYFFPGVHKLATGGLAWVTSDNLVNQMYFKWYEAGGVAPWPRIDRVPYLANGLAAAVIAFEIAMPLLVLAPRTRPLALVAAVVFHLGAGHFLYVLFPSLLACHVLLLPGERLRAAIDRLARRPAAERTACRSARPVAVVAATFSAAIVVQGARGQTQSYPFACYPTFATLAPGEIVDLAVDLVEAGGATATFRLPRLRRPDEWGTVWRLAGLYGDPPDPARLRAFAAVVVPPPRLGAGVEARIVIEAYDVRPEAWREPPRTRVPIAF